MTHSWFVALHLSHGVVITPSTVGLCTRSASHARLLRLLEFSVSAHPEQALTAAVSRDQSMQQFEGEHIVLETNFAQGDSNERRTNVADSLQYVLTYK